MENKKVKMENKWLILMGIWVAFVGACFWFVDGKLGWQTIGCFILGLAMIVFCFVSYFTTVASKKHQ